MGASNILQLRIELLDIEPLIWRRLQIPGDYTFWDLHVAIQSAFAWNDSHLHEFRSHGDRGEELRFGIPTESLVGEVPAQPGWEHQVSNHLSRTRPRLDYIYDFGDDWRHAVILEEVVSAAPGKKYPRCTAGERAGPPDDCGGPPGYADLLEILTNPDDEEFATSHAWATSMKGLTGKFHPEAFDEQRVKFAKPGPRLKCLLARLR